MRNTPPGFPRVSTFSGKPTISPKERLTELLRQPWLPKAIGAVGVLLILVAGAWGLTLLRPGRSRDKVETVETAAPPSVARREVPEGERPSLNMPHPEVPRSVPSSWRGLSLGMHRDDLVQGRLKDIQPSVDWAEQLYQPDAADPNTRLGLSFLEGRLFRIVQDFSEDPYLSATAVLPLAVTLYPKMEHYEYTRAQQVHLVTIFKTESRVFKLDFLKIEDDSFLARAELIDVDQAQQRSVQ